MTKETIFTILIAISVFGFLIFIHELGHFISARIFKVKINEFSIGMGPRLMYYDSKKSGTRYSVAIFPFGGFVAMEGENGAEGDDLKKPNNLVDATLAIEAENTAKPEANKASPSPDPARFDQKPAWQRLIITAAGAFVNIVAGFLIMTVVCAFGTMPSTTVKSFANDKGELYKDKMELSISAADSGILPGDKIISVDGKRVRIYDELAYEIMRRGIEPIEVVVERNGDRQTLTVTFPTVESQGTVCGTFDFTTENVKKDPISIIRYSFRNSVMYIRVVWESLFDLITGRYSFSALSGPVGISSEIGTAARLGIIPLLYMVVVISINLGVMNLLPVPALDGGRIITIIIEIITRKKIPARVERIINGVGLVALLSLSAVVLVKDVIQLII